MDTSALSASCRLPILGAGAGLRLHLAHGAGLRKLAREKKRQGQGLAQQAADLLKDPPALRQGAAGGTPSTPSSAACIVPSTAEYEHSRIRAGMYVRSTSVRSTRQYLVCQAGNC